MRVRVPALRAKGRWRGAPNSLGTESAGGTRGDTVSAWLDVLCKLLRLPREQTEAIREELEEHLRERVRDLMVEGEAEDAASRRAISELGDAAALADRFRRAEHAPRRRMLMNIAMLGLAAGAAVVGAVGLNHLTNQPGAGVTSPPQVRFASADVAEKTITLPADATVERFVQELGRVAGKGTHVYWDVLESQGIKGNMSIGVPMAGVSVETALMLANEKLVSGGDRMACRMTGDLLEVSTLHQFDKRDSTLVAYDVEAALGAMAPSREKGEVLKQLQQLITGVIDPEQWRENGGDLAELYMVGPKLFVKAPARFQPTVQWILAQLGSGKAGAAASPEGNKVPVLGDIPLIGPMFRTTGERQSEAGGDSGKTMFTAKGDRVVAARDGKTIEADTIGLAPGVLEARGKGVVTSDKGANPDATRVLTYSITGQIERPGVYCMPKEGVSVRRAIVAGGGKFDGINEVVVTKTENGLVNVTHRMTGNELRATGAPDPTLADGEIIEVK